MVRYDASICRDLDRASRREWLETNGLGGYASSTVCGMNTRRYHGLLVAATKPPLGRIVLLAKLEEVLFLNGKGYQLSVNRYPGVVHPDGYLYLKEFRLDPFPTFVYQIEGVEIAKSIFMPRGENTTVIQYELLGAAECCRLELRPLIAFRDYHATTHENSALDGTLHRDGGCLRLAPYGGLPSLYLAHDASGVLESAEWYRNFEYDRERERGLDFREDLFHPCTLVADLHAPKRLTVIASTEPCSLGQVEGWRQARCNRPAPGGRPFASALTRAAGQFLVRRGEWNSVIAGYHWFGDWGRDTMIALPGLTLATGLPQVARGILRAFAGVVDRGMLPNRFPDSGEAPEYNSVDSTLWFFEAVRAYVEQTGDLDFVRDRLYGVLADIVAWHERGTRYGIRMGKDGLLNAGEPGTQLTWMDARVDGRPVTPRCGLAVELQALWYNALRVMEDLARRFAQRPECSHYGELADRARGSFAPVFWNESANCLFDVVNGEDRDASIRPNQILAVSLTHTMLPPDMAARVVAAVERHLLTPFGLRTLAPSDPRYRGRYEGGPASRDAAYHQGTVWPWLLGPFLTAYIETHGRTAEALEQAGKWAAPLARYIEDEGAGQLPEVFEGDVPHRAGGCIAQAWTVGELLRAATVYTL
ncbi:MAG TPA: amylo-alpha-1,6-glucosidase [Bryobacteraceae bacterium]|nr:amylo-alpha-1,6-glucosidase [Bryobacteraceae bacterium]